MKIRDAKLTFKIVLLVLFALIIASLILALTIKDGSYAFIITTLVAMAMALLIFVVVLILGSIEKKQNKQERAKEKDKLLKALDNYQRGENILIDDKAMKDENLREVALRMEELSYQDTLLIKGRVYKKENFLDYFAKSINLNEVANMCYLRYLNPDEDIYKFIMDNFTDTYFARGENELDIIIVNFSLKTKLEEKLNQYLISKNKEIDVVYYPDYNLNEFIDAFDKEGEKNKKLNIYSKDRKEVFNYHHIFLKYLYNPNKDENLLVEFMKESLSYLPYTHAALKVNGENYKIVRYAKEKEYQKTEFEEFKYYEEIPLFKVDGLELTLVLASLNDIKVLSYQKQVILSEFMGGIIALYLPFKNQYAYKDLAKELEDLLSIHQSYSYEVDDNYNILEASANLRSKFQVEITDKKCYKTLFNRNKPCDLCPLRNPGGMDKLLPFIGSNNYRIRSFNYHGHHKIYVINLRNVARGRALLEERLLDLINNDQRGYVLAFKIEFLDDTALKYKLDKEEIIEQLFEIFKMYLINGNIYRKAEDELVYIFENASQSDVIEVARRLSFAFEDKLGINEKGIALTPKMVMLSYPLEINSIFSLDSLCRTMFALADKRGRLYRLSGEAIAVNKKRHYLEQIDISLKNDKIPLKYENIHDNKTNTNIKEVHYDYYDEEHHSIKEDQITLYAKIENLYTALIERTIRSIDFSSNNIYSLYLAREAFDKTIFAMIENEINKKKVGLDKLIIETSETYIRANLDLVKYLIDKGFVFALSSIEVDNNDLPIKVKYAKIDLKKFSSDKNYAHRVLSIKNSGVDLCFIGENKELDGRYQK